MSPAVIGVLHIEIRAINVLNLMVSLSNHGQHTISATSGTSAVQLFGEAVRARMIRIKVFNS
jgi:hypothetical protein